MKLVAREIARWPKADLWALPEGPVTVVMDDGEVTSSRRSLIYSVYFWKLYVTHPQTPALMRHHLGDRRVVSGTERELLNEVIWDCYDAYQGNIDIEVLETTAYQAINDFYNDMTYQLEPYVKSMRMKDLIDVIHHPQIRAINADIKPTQWSIDNAHRRVTKILMDPHELVGNPVAAGCQIGIFKIHQVLQCVCARGTLTDIDNIVFRYPITVGYVHGLRRLYDFMIESRSPSKALESTETPLQKSQYFNRKLQLLAGTVSDLIPGDCGSTEYLERTIMPGDISRFDGQYYVTDDGLQVFRASTAAQQGLVGKTLRFRNALMCHTPHPRGICSTCYGELSLAIVKGTNLGHVAATKIGERVSQQVLSIKHDDKNSANGSIEISEEHRRYIKYVDERNEIALADRLEGAQVTLTFDAAEVDRLPDILYVDDIDSLQASFVSSVTRMQVTVKTKKGEESEIVPVSAGKRLASISRDLLRYIKVHGWITTANGNYSIDLSNWDQDLPILILPVRHQNMLDYMMSIEHFLSGAKVTKGKSGQSKITIKSFTEKEQALWEFYEIVSTHLNVNIAHLSVLIYSCMVRSSYHHDYRLPLAGNRTDFSKLATTIAGRSLSAVMAYEYQRSIINSPISYLIKYRPNHPLDQLLELN